MKRAAIALFVGCLGGAAPASAQTSAPSARTSPATACGVPATTTSDTILGTPTSAVGGGLMGAHFGGPFGFFPVEGTAPLPGHSSPGLEITIGRPGGTTSSGTELALDVRVTNRTSSDANVMRALDGSLEHWRDPHWDLFLRDEASGAIYRWDFHGGRCGNTNPIRGEDVRTIGPGRSDDDVPGGWAAYLRQATIPVAGRYSVWVVYRYCAGPSTGIPLGQSASTPNMMLGVFVSNAIQVDVVAP